MAFKGGVIVGTVSLNATGSAVTTINTGGTGALNLGNATGNTAVTGSLTASTSLTATSGDITATNGDLIIGDTTVTNTPPFEVFQKSRSGGVITTGDFLGEIDFRGHDGTQFINGASIIAQSSGTIAANRVASNLTFSTHPDSASGTTATLRMTIASTGAITIAAPDSGVGLTISGGGLSVTGTTTSGIINATSISFDAGSNVLANFVNTTSFTPTLKFGGGSTGITYSIQQGSYSRIGKIVTFGINLALTSKGSSTGAATITGLPGLASAVSNIPLAMFANGVTVTGVFEAVTDGTTISLYTIAAGTVSTIADTAFTNTSNITFMCSYTIA